MFTVANNQQWLFILNSVVICSCHLFKNIAAVNQMSIQSSCYLKGTCEIASEGINTISNCWFFKIWRVKLTQTSHYIVCKPHAVLIICQNPIDLTTIKVFIFARPNNFMLFFLCCFYVLIFFTQHYYILIMCE
jgi:hypothetical protein